MLFSSPVFIFIFLPITLLVYLIFLKNNQSLYGKLWLVVCSLFFYGYWNPKYLALIILSIIVNYCLGLVIRGLSKVNQRRAKLTLFLGIVLNLFALFYFKYADFFIATVNQVLLTDFPALNIILPLAISFFTFQQVAFLVDTYRKECEEVDFISYCLFVSFFPQLIAGPIVHHKEMMPQFKNVQSNAYNWTNVSLGIFAFSVGLFKKLIIADTFSKWANMGFNNPEIIGFWDAWVTSLSYTFQLYFDFSGYADMAIGVALLFNIKLPRNFNSPYKATNIQEFWRRWHMTLSRWFGEYVYKVLGGNKLGFAFTLRNLFITAFISGIWHGAGWTFIIWGIFHGVAMVMHRIWNTIGFRMGKKAGWVLTFLFVNFTWVFFRAESIRDAVDIIKGMSGINGGFGVSNEISSFISYSFEILPKLKAVETAFLADMSSLWLLCFAFFIVLKCDNTEEHLQYLTRNNNIVKYSLITSVLLFVSLLSFLGETTYSEFLYFNF